MFDLKSFDSDNSKSECAAGGKTDFRAFLCTRGTAYKFAISFRSLEPASRHVCCSSEAQSAVCWMLFRLCCSRVLHLSSFVLSTNPSFIIQAAARGPDLTSLLLFPLRLKPGSPPLALLDYCNALCARFDVITMCNF